MLSNEESIKHLNEIMTEEDEKHIKARLDPIIAQWKVGLLEIGFNDADIYELARNCYLIGMLVDAVIAQIQIEKENEDASKRID